MTLAAASCGRGSRRVRQLLGWVERRNPVALVGHVLDGGLTRRRQLRACAGVRARAHGSLIIIIGSSMCPFFSFLVFLPASPGPFSAFSRTVSSPPAAVAAAMAISLTIAVAIPVRVAVRVAAVAAAVAAVTATITSTATLRPEPLSPHAPPPPPQSSRPPRATAPLSTGVCSSPRPGSSALARTPGRSPTRK